jgi:hypothetical protein
MTPLAPKLQELLAQLPQSDRLQFESLLEAVYKVRYTGSLTIHLRNGVPQQVDLGAPIRLSIVEGLTTSPHSVQAKPT